MDFLALSSPCSRGLDSTHHCVIHCGMTAKTTDPWGDGTKAAVEAPIKVKYCLYARKSTESEERQILSIDSQIKEMLQIAERENLEIVEMKRESHSAKATGQRPIFNEMIERSSPRQVQWHPHVGTGSVK